MRLQKKKNSKGMENSNAMKVTQPKMNNCSIISFQVKFYETVYPKP